MSTNVYLNHLLDRLDQDLTFVEQQGLVASRDVQLFKLKLANIPRTTTSAVTDIRDDLQSLQLGGGGGGTGSLGQCKAFWDYNKSQPDDLGFKQGDVIDIVQLVNQDWWKGTLS